MASAYPGGLDTFATNKADGTATPTDHPTHHNDLADAVNKIEAELGVNPSGGSATVAAALAGISGADLGALSLLTRPPATNAEDDHFDAGSLDGKWTTGYSGAATQNTTDLTGWLHLITGTAVLQAVPVGDWTIETEVIAPHIGAAGFTTSGLILTTGTAQASSNDARWYVGQENNLALYRYSWERFNAGVFSSSLSELNVYPQATHAFLRLEKVGTTYTALFSQTGKTWQRHFQTGSLGITPTHFGLISDGGSGGSYFNYFLRY